MNHRAHVRAIDAHAERVGRDDDLGPALGEIGLRLYARSSLEARVIRARPPAALGEALRLLLRLTARGRVHDRGSTRVVGAAERLAERGVDQALPLAPAGDLGRAQGQVRAGEAADDLGRVGRQAEPRQDLVPHDRGRRRRAGEDARGAELGEQGADPEVFRPEVVAPLADAVRLVDGHQRAVEVTQETAEAVEGQALGRDVDEREASRRHLRHPAAHLALVERRGQEGRRHAARLERLHLIRHQRHERRDDQRRAGQHGRGKLVDEALAAAGGRHQQEAPAIEQRLDRLPLAGPEARVPEPGERGVEVGRARRGRGLSG